MPRLWSALKPFAISRQMRNFVLTESVPSTRASEREPCQSIIRISNTPAAETTYRCPHILAPMRAICARDHIDRPSTSFLPAAQYYPSASIAHDVTPSARTIYASNEFSSPSPILWVLLRSLVFSPPRSRTRRTRMAPSLSGPRRSLQIRW